MAELELAHRETSSPFSVLLVEPHEQVRLSLARRLANDPRVGSVLDAPTIDDAAPIAESCHPDVVIVDPSLPGMDWRDGVRLLTELRGRSTWFLIAVHVPRGGRVLPDEATRMGVDLVLLKGLRTGELVDLLAAGLLTRH